MSMTTKGAIWIRGVEAGDHLEVLRLADRLTTGMAPWRDAAACRVAVQKWVEASIARNPDAGALFVADADDGVLAGFISVESSTHFSGDAEAYIGELVVDEHYEGRGIGRLLVKETEAWAISRYFQTLTLVTGAANSGARSFYERLGFLEEEVRLTKILNYC